MQALSSSIVRHVYFPLVQRYKGEHLLEYFENLKRDRHLSTSTLRARQWRDVQAIVTAARQAPFYAARLRDIPDPITPEAFASLPLLLRDEVREQSDALQIPGAPVAQTVNTSGSTGMAISVKIPHQAQESNFAWQWFARSWYGVQIGDPNLWVWGRPLYSTKKRVLAMAKARLNNLILVPGLDVSDEAMAQWWPKIKRFRPVYIYGYTSSLDRLAEYIEAHDKVDFPVKVVCIAGEQLFDFQRQRLSRVFHAPVVNEYGSVETGSLAYECPQGSWHLATEHTYVEFLNEAGAPCRPGELGQIVVTALHNRTMPLIRYRLGDVGGPSDESCACGRPWPLMAFGVGKTMELVQSRAGKMLSAQMFFAINRGLLEKQIHGIKIFRVIQHTLDDFTVEYVPDPGYGPDGLDTTPATQFFQAGIRDFLGQDIRIEFKPVAAILPEPTGKLRYFISELPDSYLHTNRID